MFDATAFLYTGSTPIQTGVAAGTIEAKRAAVIRGKVLKKDNSPLSGVTITILNHPELGQTLSRADGMFDMAVNGGGVLTFNYAKAGYLPAQRQIDAPWQDYAVLPDVVLLRPDPVVTTIDLTDTTQPLQVAVGSPVTDADGTRQAVVMIPQGTTATLVMADGSTQPLTTLNVRLTEYTVGTNGPESMPGELPPTSAYTYAFELSADEALATGAKEVRLSQPVPMYVENFLDFAVGGIVPVGAYDRQQAAWIPEANGRVIKILAVSGGVAQLDSNNDTVADDAATLATVGITSAEQQQLAQRYPAGRSLWRVSLPYFARWDCNWPAGPPADAISPNGPGLETLSANMPFLDTADRSPTGSAGADLAVQNQTVGQQADLVGTPFTLHYESRRSRGQVSAYTLAIPVSGATLPASVQRIAVTTRVAGRKFSQSFAPQPNLTTTFTWDGQDAYGRFLNGQQPSETVIEFVYAGIYQEPATLERVFGQAFGFPKPQGAGSRADVVLGIRWSGLIGGWDAHEQGLGGWSLAPQHGYDPIGQTLYLGDGTQVSGRDGSSDNLGNRVTTVAGGGSTAGGDGGPATSAVLGGANDVVVDAEGGLYIATGQRVRRVRPDGILTTVAGGAGGALVDGGSATAGPLCGASDVALGADGSLYIVEGSLGCHRIRRVRNGIITTVAGSTTAGLSGDGGPATAALLNTPKGVAVGADGSVYIADWGNHRLRRVSPAGSMTTIAGGGSSLTDGGPATQANVTPTEVALGADGSLYLTATDGRVRRVSTGGIITTVAGTRTGGVAADGILATQASLGFPDALAVTDDGGLYIAETGTRKVRAVSPEGIITTVAGNGGNTVSGDGGPALAASFYSPSGVAVGADGSLYIADPSNSATNARVRRVQATLPGFAGLTDIVLAAKDGREAYVFNSRGRHLRTVNTLTTSVIYSFGYDSNGKLITVTDANTNVTTITRDASGAVTGITGPYGQNNSITLDANGYLASLTNSNGETTSFSYTAGGLLTSATPPGKPASSFQYDGAGRLIQTSDPAGGGETLTRTNLATGYQVSSVTTGGQSSTYKVEYLADGQQKRTNTMPDGTVETTQIRTDGSQVVTQSDGITQTVAVTGDPRFGLQSPMPTSLAVTTPGGKNGTLTNARTTNLSDPTNPLSLTAQTDTVAFNGRTATRTYNATTRTSTDTSPAGRVRTTVTDTQGRVTQQQQGNLAATAFSYDSRGRLASRSQGGRSTSLTYDTLGRPAMITDSAARTVQFQYDSAGRVTQQTLPDNRVIAYSYDASGNVTSITPPGRPAHEFTYTAVNLEQSYLPPNPQPPIPDPRTLYTYNADRQVTGITRPDGQQITLAYSGGKLSSQSFPGLPSSVSGLLS
ncbi:MAG: RHS repeat-associated core domain-containing protein, partial [Gammaproteobacteria bacterium]